MGLQFRKRKKTGTNSWTNYSASGVSFSRKCGNATYNSRGKVTFNLGNGFRFVSGSSKRTPITFKDIVIGVIILSVLLYLF